jgi:biopolymer transport protein ExbB
MNSVLHLFARGGPVMIAIAVLSVLLYSRCFRLLIALRGSARELVELAARKKIDLAAARARQHDLQETLTQQRLGLGAMIAAAPLLGLLGTVNGMTKTFESIANQAGGQSMEGLAGGISEVLVATESGLAVALPALLLVYLAHREVHRHGRKISAIEAEAAGELES